MESTDHVETLISKLPRLISRRAVYSSGFVVLLSRSLDRGNGLFQLFIHCSVKNWMTYVVSQVKRTYEERVDIRLGNGIDLKKQSGQVLG